MSTGLIMPAQYDVLCRVFNGGFVRMADALAVLLGGSVRTNLQDVQVCSVQEFVRLQKRDSWHLAHCVSQHYEGAFDGCASFVVQAEDMTVLTKLIVDADGEQMEGAICEIANLVINSCLCVLGEALGETFRCSFPVVEKGEGPPLSSADPTVCDLILCAEVSTDCFVFHAALHVLLPCAAIENLLHRFRRSGDTFAAR